MEQSFITPVLLMIVIKIKSSDTDQYNCNIKNYSSNNDDDYDDNKGSSNNIIKNGKSKFNHGVDKKVGNISSWWT